MIPRKVISFGLGSSVSSQRRKLASRHDAQFKYQSHETCECIVHIDASCIRGSECDGDIVWDKYFIFVHVVGTWTLYAYDYYHQHIVTDMNCHINIAFVLEFIRQWLSSHVSHGVGIDFVDETKSTK